MAVVNFNQELKDFTNQTTFYNGFRAILATIRSNESQDGFTEKMFGLTSLIEKLSSSFSEAEKKQLGPIQRKLELLLNSAFESPNQTYEVILPEELPAPVLPKGPKENKAALSQVEEKSKDNVLAARGIDPDELEKGAKFDQGMQAKAQKSILGKERLRQTLISFNNQEPSFEYMKIFGEFQNKALEINDELSTENYLGQMFALVEQIDSSLKKAATISQKEKDHLHAINQEIGQLITQRMNAGPREEKQSPLELAQRALMIDVNQASQDRKTIERFNTEWAKLLEHFEHSKNPALKLFYANFARAALRVNPNDDAENFFSQVAALNLIVDPVYQDETWTAADFEQLEKITDKIRKLSSQASDKMLEPVAVHLPKSSPIEEKREQKPAQVQASTRLLDAMTKGQTDEALEILDKEDINQKSSHARFGYTPLILAAAKGPEDVGVEGVTQRRLIHRLLFKRGLNVMAVDNKGRTALHYACLHKDTALIKELTKFGAQWDKKDDKGQTPLDFLFHDYKTAKEILEDAIEKREHVPQFMLAPFQGAEMGRWVTTLVPKHLCSAINEKLEAFEPLKRPILSLRDKIEAQKESMAPALKAGSKDNFFANDAYRELLAPWSNLYQDLYNIACTIDTTALSEGCRPLVTRQESIQKHTAILEKIAAAKETLPRSFSALNEGLLQLEAELKKSFKALGPVEDYQAPSP